MKVAFRADASVRTGSGHVMRCLGLAEHLAGEGADVHFYSAALDRSVASRAASLGFGLTWLPVPYDAMDPADLDAAGRLRFSAQDAASFVAAAGGGSYDAVVVDHYALGREWESAVRKVVSRVACIDDLADRPHDCDLLVDHNPGRGRHDYTSLVPPATRCLIGPRYALLRREFMESRAEARVTRDPGSPTRLLVSLGGTDPDNVTLDVLEGLDASRFPAGTQVRVLLGPGAPWRDMVADRLDSMRLDCELIVDPPSVAKLLSDCDAAVGAGGVSALERCCLGVPSLVIIVAENQRRGARALDSLGAVLGVVEREDVREMVAALDPSLPERGLVSQAGMDLVDGLGIHRVADAIRTMCDA